MNTTTNKPAFAFFGSSQLSVTVLEELRSLGLLPDYIVTTPDKPVGRKQTITANIVKQWAINNNIRAFDPAKLDQDFIQQLKAINKAQTFLVASYGSIIPEKIIDIPEKKTLNIHPSLLPRYRGPSPLPTAILDDTKETGVTIIRIDEKMDHGPIIAQKNVTISEWPIYEQFEAMMAKEGAKLFAGILTDWIDDKLEEREQDHSQATYTRKVTKEDGHILSLDRTDGNDIGGQKDSLSDKYSGKDAHEIFRKIQAFHEWPQAFFFVDHNGKKIRIKITEADFKDGVLTLRKVIPEGSREMSYESFIQGYNK